MRPSKLQNFMEVAHVIKKRSHDVETQVGAVLVNNASGSIIATGFNGFVRGTEDGALPNKRPDKYPYIIHAEQNLIANCARHGISMNDCMMVCTLSPCVSCMRLLFQCGITRIVVNELYKDFEDISKIKDLNVDMKKTEEGFYELTYSIN